MIKKGYYDLNLIDNFHKNIDYKIHENPTSGFLCTDLEDNNRYNKENINVYISRDIPIEIKSFFQKNFSWLYNHEFSVQLMKPGMILPIHSDRYSFYKAKYKVEIDDIERVIVFLDNWSIGHLLHIDNIQVQEWIIGDWVSWQGNRPHLAANLGHTNRYTLQITGTKK